MKKILSVLVTILAFNLSNAQSISPERLQNAVNLINGAPLIATNDDRKVIQPTIGESYYFFKTQKYGEVEVFFSYEQKNPGTEIDQAVMQSLIDVAMTTLSYSLKSRRSLVPLSVFFKYVNHPKGKHRYKVNISYEATNSYGGEVEGFHMMEFNKKFKETVGSVMARMN